MGNVGTVDCFVTWTPEGGTASILTDVTQVTIRRGSDAKNSKADITLHNANRKHITTGGSSTSTLNFDFDDEINVYCSFETIDDSDLTANGLHLLFSGIVTGMKIKSTDKKNEIKLVATDKTDVLLSRAISGKLFEADTTTTAKIANLIDQANEGSATNITYTTAGTDPSIENVATTTEYSAGFKKISEHIQALSVTQYTGGNRPYVFHITEDNVFHWFQPVDVVSSTLSGDITATGLSIVLADGSSFGASGFITIENEIIYFSSRSGNTLTVSADGRGYAGTDKASHTSGTSVYKQRRIVAGQSTGGLNKVISMNMSKSSDDTINMLIMRLGKDSIGRGITWYRYNVNTSTNKLRMKIMDWRHISSDYYDQIILNNSTKPKRGQTEITSTWTPSSYPEDITVGDSAELKAASGQIRLSNEDNYEVINYASKPNATTVRITAATDRGQSGTMIPNTWEAGTIVKDWTPVVTKTNSTVRSDIRVEGEKAADEWFIKQKEKWKGNITLQGTLIYPNDLILLTNLDAGINLMPLRVKDITHNIMGGGWTTIIKVEEDEEKR